MTKACSRIEKPLLLALALLAMPIQLASEDREISLPPGSRLELVAPHTELVITGTDGSTVKLTATSLENVEVLERGGVVQIRTGQPPTQPPRLEIGLPWGHDLFIEASYSAVTVQRVRCDVSVRQASAPVRLTEIVGDVDVINNYDRVLIDGVEGSVRSESFGHDVEVTDVTGDVWARSAANRVTVSRVGGDRVDLSSVSGHVSYRGPVRPDGRYNLSSHLGGVVLEIPSDSDATVVLGGQLSAVTVKGASLERIDDRNAEVRLGEGRARIEIYSFEGAMEVIVKR